MNPILAMLNNSNSGNLLARISQIRNIMNGNPDAVYNQLIQINPQFRQFVEQNKGKSPEQIARENGINPELLK